MTMPSKVVLEHEFASDLREIQPLAHAVAQALSSHPELVYGVNLCLDEIITNTIMHGHEGTTNGHIRVRIELSDRCIDIEVRDDAPAYNPLTEAPVPDLQAKLHERPIGGLGVHLVKKIMSEVTYAREHGWNVMRMRKHTTRST